jgi:cysteine-rich repeat protein
MLGAMHRGLVLGAAIMAASLTACIEPNLTTCSDGLECAAGEACDVMHHGCVAPDQLANCAGSADYVPCTWDEGAASGECFSGVCLVAGCGNGILEPGEACDDGNRVSGDTCNADCTSNETCGNHIVDLDKGEKCDDGNLLSRDGCDSACQLETASWSTIGVDPLLGLDGHGAFDEHRGRFVYFDNGLTWEWTGTAWEIESTGGPPRPSWYTLVYDAHRAVVTLIGTDAAFGSLEPVDLVWDWDGTTWTARTPDPAGAHPQGAAGIAAYDRGTNTIMLFTYNAMWAWDPSAASAWSSVPAPTFASGVVGGASMAYDATASALVLVVGGFTGTSTQSPVTYVMTDDLQFTTTSGGGLAGSGTPYGAPSLVYDPVLGGVVGFGGVTVTQSADESGSLTFFRTAELWNGSDAWVVQPQLALPAARQNPAVVFDTTGQQLLAFGGEDGAAGNVAHDDLQAFGSAGAWNEIDLTFPHGASNAYTAYDPRAGQLVLVQGDGGTRSETWTYDTAWNLVVQGVGSGTVIGSPQVPNQAALAYDPIRAGTVFVGLTSDKTLILTGGAWSELGSGIGLGNPFDVTFDAKNRQLVAVRAASGGGASSVQLWALPSDGSGSDLAWTTLGDPLAGAGSAKLAFDANGGVLVIQTDAGLAYTFDGTSFVPTLSRLGRVRRFREQRVGAPGQRLDAARRRAGEGDRPADLRRAARPHRRARPRR